ncbi:hypothetical protein L0B53_15610 [Vibrio sp. SS-MA-C1-2]|uniref:hypothetical protein n=1 Tax=Vibrio sp. SS-MA-C1-2 TaxID=2908646 RepID=UPI001F43B8B9|nr:hypothetical protein [Vibrio sp. SS-MA-C1-2]UJF18433.1 hypothetical protein L0B53_15610 [Vibrio sp. SS-MA-C1-2]
MIKSTTLDETHTRWDFFQKHHWVSPDFSFTAIVSSWERCHQQSNAYKWTKPQSASGYTLSSIQRKNDLITSIVSPIIDNTLDTLSSEIAIGMTDAYGCIMHLSGNGNITTELEQLGFKIGTFFNEGQVGTNSINLAIQSHESEKVFAAEHYKKALHPYSSCASPFFPKLEKMKVLSSSFREMNILTKKISLLSLPVQKRYHYLLIWNLKEYRVISFLVNTILS